MKIFIVSPQCSGSHWVARSISKSLKIPYGYYHHEISSWPNSKEEMIIVSHQEFNNDLFEKMKNDDIKIIGLTRNPLDHLISYCHFHKYSINDIESIAATKDFLYQRKISNSIPDKVKVSYEGLVNKTELEKLKKILEIKNLILEKPSETKKELPEIVRLAKANYWNIFINNEKAKKICNIIGEDFQ